MTHQAKRDLTGIAKSIDSGQPAQSAQADQSRNFSLLVDFLYINDNSAELNHHFEIVEPYRPVLACFIILSRSSDKAHGSQMFYATVILHYKTEFTTSETFRVNKTIPSWEALKARFPMLKPGGRFIPTGCRAGQKLAIIVPYRNRERHLKLFLQHMHPFLQLQKVDYTIYVIELVSNQSFSHDSFT